MGLLALVLTYMVRPPAVLCACARWRDNSCIATHCAVDLLLPPSKGTPAGLNTNRCRADCLLCRVSCSGDT